MSVQGGGGGGGKKIPPGGPSRPPAATPSVARPAPAKLDLGKAAPAKEAAPASPKSDSFDAHFKSTGGEMHRLDEALAHAATPSGIDNLVRLLEASRAQLAAEHRALRAQSQSIVEKLVNSGFAPQQLEKARAELHELRKKMAALRKRLQHLQRRLKSAYASAGKTGDANFARLLGAQLDRLRKLGPGLSRALLLLQTVEQAYGAFADGGAPVLRLDVSSATADKRLLLGNAVGAAAPGSAIARATLALLREGADADLPVAEANVHPDTPALDGTRALTLALAAPGGRSDVER